MADERCVCHINGYRVKDTTARQSATNAGMMANSAMEKATSYEKQIADAVTTANKAKYTAERVEVTAKASYTAAETASAAAAAAAETANSALPKSGGTMTGDINMNGREITNAMNVQARGVFLKEPNAGYDVSIEAMTEPGVVHAFCAKNVQTGVNRYGSVIIRGVAPGVNDNDAANMEQVRKMVGYGQNLDYSAGNAVFGGLTAHFFGDSLTEQNYHYTKGYHAWVKEILGLASYKNYGVSGYKVSDVYNKVKSVADSADIVFVMCGVNDQNFSVPLGAMGDNTTGTTYGALGLLCAELKSKYPTSIIIFITPTYQTKYPHSSGVTSYDVSKAIREVCEKYAIPVYDNFVSSGIYSTNLSTFTTDNCHWNDTAHEMVGKNLAGFVSDSFRYVYGATSGGNGGNGGDSGGGEEGGDTTEPVTGFSGNLNATIKAAEVGGVTHIGFLVENPNIGAASTIKLTAGVTPINKVRTYVNGPFAYTSIGNFNSGVYASIGGMIDVVAADGGITSQGSANSSNPYYAIFIPFDAAALPFDVTISDVKMYINGTQVEILAVGTFKENTDGNVADITILE